jgi:hypothetical protein
MRGCVSPVDPDSTGFAKPKVIPAAYDEILNLLEKTKGGL